MKHYIKVYIRILRINFSEFKAYRANMLNTFLSSTTWGIFAIVGPLLLTSNVTIVVGWKREELLILAAIQSILIGIFDCLFARSLSRLPLYVELGQLDSYLLKPVNDQFFISLHKINYGSLLRSGIGIFFLIYLIYVYHIQITPLGLFFGISALCMGLLSLYAIWFISMTLTLWFTRLSNISDLLYTLRGISRYPEQIMREVSIYVFILFFPLAIVVARPTALLLNKMDNNVILISFIFTAILLYVSHRVWLFALRSYTSASS